MSESPEVNNRIAKIQKDVEQLKEFMRDSIHDRPEVFEKRILNALEGHPACVILWLEIDGHRSLMEIEESLKDEGKPIAHATLWRAAKRLSKGLIYKTGVKGISPVYAKKIWAEELDIDEYVREKFGIE
jgi:hypothetical protein